MSAGETIERPKASQIVDAAVLADRLRQVRGQMRLHGDGGCDHLATVQERLYLAAGVLGGAHVARAMSTVLLALLTKAESETAAALEALGYEVDVE